MEARLIISGGNPGAWNMALDEAILQSIAAGDAAITLRLYAWEPPCLSLGYAQSLADVDQTRLESLGWELVRRPTGGKAILHADELTYSIAGPAEHPIFVGGILPSYRRLSAPLTGFLRSFGLPVQTVENKTEDNNNPICFEIPGAYELVVHGKKTIGSAQVRRSGAVLQHGSIPLSGDISRVCKVLAIEDSEIRKERSRAVIESAATIESLTGAPLKWELAARKLSEAFQADLEFELLEAEPTDKELKLAEELVLSRYGTCAWTERM